MRVVVTADGAGLDAAASPIFGRCPNYVFVDTETLQWEAVENPGRRASGGAGIQAARFIIDHGAGAVVTGQVGPNASSVFQAAGVPVYLFSGGTVGEAVVAFRAGKLPPAQSGGRGRDQGGRAAGMAPPPAPAAGREETIVRLRETVGALRRQLAQVMDEIDRLQKE